jgi:myo-inositol-1(or 4)-monophosphatase
VCASLVLVLLPTPRPFLIKKNDRAAFGELEDKVKLSRYGGDCYAYCMLAAGLIDLIIETEIKPYDIVAVIPIVAGAGGIVTTWENGPAQGGGRIVVAGDRRVHAAALEVLAR